MYKNPIITTIIMTTLSSRRNCPINNIIAIFQQVRRLFKQTLLLTVFISNTMSIWIVTIIIATIWYTYMMELENTLIAPPTITTQASSHHDIPLLSFINKCIKNIASFVVGHYWKYGIRRYYRHHCNRKVVEKCTLLLLFADQHEVE